MPTVSREPREMTAEECREAFLAYVHTLVLFWEREARVESLRERLDGLAFSILAALDGSAGGVPAFLVAPDPHPDDKAYRRENGEDWWPENHTVAVAGQLTELHEHYYRTNRERVVMSLAIDWKHVALALLDCFGMEEGTWHEFSWEQYGIPAEWHAEIERQYRLRYPGRLKEPGKEPHV